MKLPIVLAAALTLASAGAALAQSQDKSWQNATGALPAQSPGINGNNALSPQSTLVPHDALSSAIPGLTTPSLTPPAKSTSPLLPLSPSATGPRPQLDWNPSSRSYPTQPTAQQTPHVDITAPMGRRGVTCGGDASTGAGNGC